MLILVAFIFATTSQSIAGILFYDNCEDKWSSNDWKEAGEDGNNTLTVSKEKARNGESSYKFVLAPYGSDSTETNVELILRAIKNENGNANFKFETDYWMGWSVYIPSDFTFPSSDNNVGCLGQWHAAPDSCDTLPQTQPLSFQLLRTTEGFNVPIAAKSDPCGSSSYDNKQNLKTPSLVKGQWNDIVIHFRFSYKGNGITQIWQNGKLVIDNYYDNAMNDAKGPYFKMGIYAHADTYMTVYYDEIRVGDENSSYDEVAPRDGGGVADSGDDLDLMPSIPLAAPTLSIVR
jgi:hypothetical protein